MIARNICLSDLGDPDVLDSLIADSWTRLARLQDDCLAGDKEPGWWLERQVELDEQAERSNVDSGAGDDKSGLPIAVLSEAVASFVEHFNRQWCPRTDEERARVQRLASAGLASGEDPCDLAWRLVNDWSSWREADAQGNMLDEVF